MVTTSHPLQFCFRIRSDMWIFSYKNVRKLVNLGCAIRHALECSCPIWCDIWIYSVKNVRKMFYLDKNRPPTRVFLSYSEVTCEYFYLRILGSCLTLATTSHTLQFCLRISCDVWIFCFIIFRKLYSFGNNKPSINVFLRYSLWNGNILKIC